jgi:hypothetical protein
VRIETVADQPGPDVEQLRSFLTKPSPPITGDRLDTVVGKRRVIASLGVSDDLIGSPNVGNDESVGLRLVLRA